jgi:hypothetical protein
MPWPFSKKSTTAPLEMVRLPDVALTCDEQRECQEFMALILPPSNEGHLYVRPDLADAFKRNLLAMAMMGRAERFAILARESPEFRSKACEAAAKASAIYPLSIYVFDFARILDDCGEREQARTMFAEFLRRHAAGPISEIDESSLNQRDLPTMVEHANARLRTR